MTSAKSNTKSADLTMRKIFWNPILTKPTVSVCLVIPKTQLKNIHLEILVGWLGRRGLNQEITWEKMFL